jgi:hypothetical protein
MRVLEFEYGTVDGDESSKSSTTLIASKMTCEYFHSNVDNDPNLVSFNSSATLFNIKYDMILREGIFLDEGSRCVVGNNILLFANRFESKLLYNNEVRSFFDVGNTFTLDLNSALIQGTIIKAYRLVINIHGENGDVVFEKKNNKSPWIFARHVELRGKGKFDLRAVKCNCAISVLEGVNALLPPPSCFNQKTFDRLCENIFYDEK